MLSLSLTFQILFQDIVSVIRQIYFETLLGNFPRLHFLALVKLEKKQKANKTDPTLRAH